MLGALLSALLLTLASRSKDDTLASRMRDHTLHSIKGYTLASRTKDHNPSETRQQMLACRSAAVRSLRLACRRHLDSRIRVTRARAARDGRKEGAKCIKT